MSAQNQLDQLDSLKESLAKTIEALRSSNPAFEHAYETYIQQYGRDTVSIIDPINLVDTVDPVILVFGRNTAIRYFDSKKLISGSFGSLNLKQGTEYIIGRRQPQDSKLMIWSPKGDEVELEGYNPEVGIIPSRIHATIVFRDDRHIFFADLVSSSGTVLIGESKRQAAFVRVYDPGSAEFPRIKLTRVYTSRKD
ncbi:MAG: hypothetical protein PXY39_05125 [archaeon]|nr:hypothetical protein [archaeon]